MSESNEIRIVNHVVLHLRRDIETNIYKLNQTLDHKLNKKLYWLNPTTKKGFTMEP